MLEIKFEVDGRPPNKTGAKSMWGREGQVPRLIALREAAHRALEALPDSPRFTRRPIRLTLRVRVVPGEEEEKADLDHYIAGVCDGLMAAHPNAHAHLHESFAENPKVDPKHWFAIEDDSKIDQIRATRCEVQDRTHYWVEIEGP